MLNLNGVVVFALFLFLPFLHVAVTGGTGLMEVSSSILCDETHDKKLLCAVLFDIVNIIF
jgi:hypothetical protein